MVFGEEPPAVAWPGDGPGPGEEEQKERGLKTLFMSVQRRCYLGECDGDQYRLWGGVKQPRGCEVDGRMNH